MSKKNLIRNVVVTASLIGYVGLANYTSKIHNQKTSNPEYLKVESRMNFTEEVKEDISSLEREIVEIGNSYNKGDLKLNDFSVENRFWSNFNRPDVYDEESKSLIKKLSLPNQVLFRSALPFISLIKKAEEKYGLQKENILLPLVIIATESGGNPYTVGKAFESGLGQFIVGGARNAGFNLDSSFEKYFVKNVKKYSESKLFGPIVIADTLSDLAKEHNTTIFEEYAKLGSYDERTDPEKSIECIVKNISTILRLNRGNSYKLITHYNAGPGLIPRFELISKENGNESWVQYPTEKILELFERVREIYSIDAEKSVFPRNTIMYLKGYNAFKNEFYDKEEQKIIQEILNKPDSFYDELLNNYKEVYKDFFSKRLAVFEAKENHKTPRKIFEEHQRGIAEIKERLKYCPGDFPQLWEIESKVDSLRNSINNYKKYVFK